MLIDILEVCPLLLGKGKTDAVSAQVVYGVPLPQKGVTEDG